MPVCPDYEEFVASLNASNVKYLIVGGHAVGFHGAPRWTKDMDIWVEPSSKNAMRFLHAVEQFFGERFGLELDDIVQPDVVLQFGVAPIRIDVMTSIAGVEFLPCWRRRVVSSYGAQRANYISLEDLIRNKEAVGRQQDLLDVRKLLKAEARRAKPRTK